MVLLPIQSIPSCYCLAQIKEMVMVVIKSLLILLPKHSVFWSHMPFSYLFNNSTWSGKDGWAWGHIFPDLRTMNKIFTTTWPLLLESDPLFISDATWVGRGDLLGKIYPEDLILTCSHIFLVWSSLSSTRVEGRFRANLHKGRSRCLMRYFIKQIARWLTVPMIGIGCVPFREDRHQGRLSGRWNDEEENMGMHQASGHINYEFTYP